MEYFKNYCAEKITLHPKLQVHIINYFMLAQDEIESGGSEQHEVELAINDIEDLIRNSDFKTFNESPYGNN